MTTLTITPEFRAIGHDAQMKLAKKLVEINVYGCCTSIVQFSLDRSEEDSAAPIRYDELENNEPRGYIRLSDGNDYYLTDEEIADMLADEDIELTDEDIEGLEQLEADTYPEWVNIYRVSEYLLCKLRQQGELVHPEGYWFRADGNSSLESVTVMQLIAFDCYGSPLPDDEAHEIAAQIADATERNDHGGAALLIAKYIDDGMACAIDCINHAHQQRGHILSHEKAARGALLEACLSKLEAEEPSVAELFRGAL